MTLKTESEEQKQAALSKIQDVSTKKQVASPTTIGKDGTRKWIYPERRTGFFTTRRKYWAFILIAFYLIVPWLSIGPNPLLRVDVLSGYAYFFGLVFHMNEYNFTFFLFIAAGLLLFLVTTVKGKVWCGYACPQTVFTEWVIRPIEEFIEGRAIERQRSDAGPLTTKKLLKKILKHGLFFVVVLIIANAFLGFFIDPKTVVKWILSPPTEHPIAFGFTVFLVVLMYFDLVWFREQYCAFLCPYARFQSVLLDSGSPAVTYLEHRGEPRAKGGKGGDCIDCGLCVRVCPVGIDIRDGLQLECIQCMRCIDACDSIAKKSNKPPGLIKMTSADEIAGTKQPFFKRIRVLVYFALIVIILAIGFYKIRSRDNMALVFLRQAGTAYSSMPDGRIANMFNIRGINNTDTSLSLGLMIIEPKEGVEFICPRCNVEVKSRGEEVSPILFLFAPDIPVKEIIVQSKHGGALHVIPIIKPGM